MIVEIWLLAVVIALVRGGSFRNLAVLKINHFWLAFIPAFGIFGIGLLRCVGFEPQVLRVSGVIHILAQIPILILLLVNRRMQGTLLIVLGVTLNLLPIVFNGGRMPVNIDMARVARMEHLVEQYVKDRPMATHCVMTEKTRFNWLADFIPLRRPPLIIATVSSPGDIIMSLGMGLLLYAALGAPFGKRRNAENI